MAAKCTDGHTWRLVSEFVAWGHRKNRTVRNYVCTVCGETKQEG